MKFILPNPFFYIAHNMLETAIFCYLPEKRNP